MPLASRFVALAFVVSSTALAQQYPPAFSFASMLEGYFDDSSGLVSFGDYHVAFAPENGFNGEAVIINDKTEILARFAFFPEYGLRDGVFTRVRIQGPAEFRLTTPGTYFHVFLVDGEPVSRLPFVLRQTSAGDDPFDPEKTFAFDGYWRTFGYLTMGTVDDELFPEVNFWIGGLDLPPGASRDGLFVELRRGDATVAHSKRAQGNIPPGHFEWQQLNLFHPHTERQEPNADLFMLTDWEAVDGDYELRITRNSDGQTLRSFDFEVRGRKIVPHPRSALGFQPKHDYLLPRVLRRFSNVFEMEEAIWLEDRSLR